MPLCGIIILYKCKRRILMEKSFRKILATVLTVVMVMTAAPLSGIADFDWESLFATKVSAADSVGFLTTISTADSKATKIKTAKELHDYLESKPSGKYVLANDIDLSSYNDGYWNPIQSEFSGTLDGQGHKISNLNIWEYSRAGLIDRLYEATIKNLCIEADEINAGYSGVVATYIDNSSIYNCVIRANTVSNGYCSDDIICLGGICATSDNSSFEYLNVSVNKIISENYAYDYYWEELGGLMGSGSNIEVSNCNFYGSVLSNCSGSSDGGKIAIGGIIGDASDCHSVSIKNTWVDGTIKAESDCGFSYRSEYVDDWIVYEGPYAYVGGLIGNVGHWYGTAHIYYNDSFIFDNCEINAEIYSKSRSSAYAGGIFGSFGGMNVTDEYETTIKSCTLRGSIVSEAPKGGFAQAAGFFGCFNFGDAVLIDCCTLNSYISAYNSNHETVVGKIAVCNNELQATITNFTDNSSVGGYNNYGTFEIVEDPEISYLTNIFSENKYIADIWLNRRGGEATSESKLVSEILSYSSISSEIYNDLLKNDDFTDSLKGWTTLKSLFDSVDLAKDTLNEKDIYETLILDLLKKASKNNINDSNRIIYDALDIAGDVADNVSKYKKIIFSMSSMVKGSDKVVLDLFKNWKINPKNTETYKKFFSIISEYEKESDSIKKWSDNGFVEGIGALAEVASDVSDFYKRVAAYMYITDMSDEMVTLLKEMYKNTSSESFKNAIADVLIGFENENYINLLLTCKLSTDIAFSVTDALYDDVSEAIPGYNLLKTSYGVAVTFDDLMFNTSNTLDKFYLIQATYNFIDANKKAINTFKNNYLSSNSETDADSYVYAVKTYNHAYEIDLESAVSFTKAASNEGLINYAKRGVKCLINLVTGSNLKTSYQSFSESKDNIVKNLDFLFYSLDNSWKFNEEYLQKDFPDVYPVYLTEELSKEVYKPSITSCYIEKSGKTDMEWSVPYNFKASDGQYYPLYGSLWINGIESSETVGTSKTNSNYNSISNAPNPIQFYNRSKFSTFPKTYAIKAYSNTSSGKVYTPTETMKMEKPVKNVSISLSMSEFLRRSGDGVSITVTDNSESVYDYIKYSIYRKTNNSSWTLLKTIDRDFNLRGYNTVFVDDTVSEGNQYTYKVVSSITFDNGVTIKSGDSNEISVNGTKTSPMVNNLRTERISKSTPVLKTRMLKAAPARNTQSGIKISWDTIDNAKQYEIYRMVSYGTVYNLIATVDGNTLSYIDEDVRDAVGYDYLVVPCTVSGANKTYETNVCAQGGMTYASGNVKSVSVDDIEIKYKTSAIITPNVITDGYINYTATYESSNPSVATVDKNGNITTHHKGNTTITCTVTDGYGNTTKDTCTVNVKFQWWQWLIWILLFGFLWY